MSSGRKQLWIMGGALASAMALCGAGVVAAQPAVSNDSSRQFSEILLNSSSGLFTPAGLDAKSAERFRQAAVASRGKFRFTPAGVGQARTRAVTVAIRASSDETPRAVSVRNVIAQSEAGLRTSGNGETLTVKPTKYELGTAKGWTSFALPNESRKSNLPAIGQISAGAGYRLDEEERANKRSKFNTRVTLDSPSSGRTLQRRMGGANEYALDVGGSYSITKGVDVTAGVRYESEQQAPLVDEQQDSQAVYLGTLIRF